MNDPLVIVVDTREQTPWKFDGYPVRVKRAKLDTGDYSVHGFEDIFAIERKSLDDLVNTTVNGRDRFQDELIRGNKLAEFDVYIESSKADLKAGNYYSQAHPNSIIGSINAWERTHSADFYFTGSRDAAEARAYSQLFAWSNKYSHLFV
ncbi:ERCC4 domain-containing protein [Halobellus limi]|uniref:ERCC4 domain-containing protein n=1 Tax=Halobellus limi TaxID=699433 RepID=A0A1H5ZFQ9_9EURY|nr:ERCC4 domain-containing protein [Halobellus limi]QCC48116.1 hypothetical protein DV707_10830 [Halobellus limi]SEG34884.1 ERCC4 domain-containing protein [Halobellus limi]